MSSEWDREQEHLQAEATLLSRLGDVEKAAIVEARQAHVGDQSSLLFDLVTLIRAYRRKWHEASHLKEYLGGIRDFLVECWDEEEEEFEPMYAGGNIGGVGDRWCPALIEELGEVTEDDIVYTPLPLPQEGPKKSKKPKES